MRRWGRIGAAASRHWWVAVVVGALVALGVAAQPGPTGSPARATSAAPRGAGLALAAPAPPVTAAPQPPGPPLTPAEQGLQNRLAAAIGGDAGCAVAWAAGTRVAAVNPGLPLAPASTQKLVVAAAALRILGPDYRFVTQVVAAPVVGGGTPRLWLVGSGDPMLATADYGAELSRSLRYAGAPLTPLEWLADQLVARGIRTVPAGVVGDDSRYSAVRYLPTWSPVNVTEGDVGPLSALSLDEGWQAWTRRFVPAADPPAHAAESLAEMLAHRGVGIGPTGPDGPAPAGSVVVASVASAPLSQIVGFMLSASDNHVAEMLTRELGLRLYGDGSTPAGTRAVLAVARDLGLPTGGATMVDGSGLSPENRATCAELLSAYELAGHPGMSVLHDGLSVAGVRGTLAGRWRGTPLAGHLTAKTGWITGAAAMVGTVQGTTPVDFALVVNGPATYGAGIAVEDRAVTALAGFRGA